MLDMKLVQDSSIYLVEIINSESDISVAVYLIFIFNKESNYL